MAHPNMATETVPKTMLILLRDVAIQMSIRNEEGESLRTVCFTFWFGLICFFPYVSCLPVVLVSRRCYGTG